MELQAVVTDLDGTLLDNEKLIHPEDLATAARLKAQGVKIFIATGRHLALTHHYARQLGADGIIASNGAVYYHCHQSRVTEEHILTPRQVEDIRGFQQEHRLPFFVYTRDFPCYMREDQRVRPANHGFIMGKGPDFGNVVRFMEEVEDIWSFPLLKVVFPQLLPCHLPLLSRDFADCKLEIYQYDTIMAEIGPEGCGKGSALERALAPYGISPGNTLAMGDNYNDVSMLEVVGCPVIPENAFDDIKTLARYVCADNDSAPLTDAVRFVEQLQPLI